MDILKKIFKLPADAWRHWIGVTGIFLTTLFALLFIGAFAFALVGVEPGPYSGIVTVIILPAAFVGSLFLIALGGYLARRRRVAAARETRLPVIDLNDRHTLQTTLTVGVLTAVNFLLVGAATYRGIEYMESVQFCGRTCHTVMEPEFATYSRSPHSRVRCVECHIGPGAPWFVKSKLSGSYQVISVLFHLYPRPVPAPIQNLRPARETCEQCHWPDKFQGKLMRVHNRYQTDAANTKLTNVLMVNIGGIDPKTRKHEGIHWHISPSNRVSYYASDERRSTIPYVKVEDLEANTTKVFTSEAGYTPPPGAELRVMDCIDCHNRPTHIYEDPGRAVDKALDAGRLPLDLPCVKGAVLEAVKKEFKTREEATQGIEAGIRDFYKTKCKEAGEVSEAAMKLAVDEARSIYFANVFPTMNVQWNTYSNQIGHNLGPGCYRCHDDAHKAEGGEVISQDCDLCHSIIAMEESNPEILEKLLLSH